MASRWRILTVLFVARTVIGLQYQSVASAAPLLMRDLGIEYTHLGALIGLSR